MSTSRVLYLEQLRVCQTASTTALLYDYMLAFGNEVDLIWAREWNLMTLLYAIVRYLSLFLVIDIFLYISNINWTPNVSLVWYQLRMWEPYIFRVAMDIIMTKRIYALSCSSSRFLSLSRWVVFIIAIAFIDSGITFTDDRFSGMHACDVTIPSSEFVVSSQFPTLGFEALLFVLAFGYFVVDVWESRRSKPPATWKVNDIVQIMIRDSTIYFVINVLMTAMKVANYYYPTPSPRSIYEAVLFALQSFPVYCFAPRLVLNLKAHENRTHMSEFGRELSNIRFTENPLQQTTQLHDVA
ncbi:hypothetical protein JVU11DRAFT_4148 [Chiua virens]|nr:hypothetical protein JVU11DRAFT_4148 [Chiua virens]